MNIYRQALLKLGINNNSANIPTDKPDFEQDFHDRWAENIDVSKINVLNMNESVTAPEMKYFMSRIGDLKGKKVLDIGCGAGESSVYFALQGAEVTALDLSEKMLEVVTALAEKYKVKVNTVRDNAEDITVLMENFFDVVYIGNLLHHVNLQMAMKSVLRCLRDDGLFICWEPLRYNPVIKVYRRLAWQVRTPGEKPLGRSDIAKIRSCFQDSDTKFFWFFTLTIFILMWTVCHLNPRKVRFWKKVVEDGDKWAWLYNPLKLADEILLETIPALGYLCWNVAIVGRKPDKKHDKNHPQNP